VRILIGSALAAAALALTAAPAMAQEFDGPHVYAGVGAGATKSGNLWLGAVQAKVGVQVNPYIAVEADYDRGVGGNPRMGNTYAGYLVGTAPFGNFEVLGKVGYGSLEIEQKIGSGVTVSASEFLFTYGIGARYRFGGKNAVRLDLTRFGDYTDTGVALAYERTF